jgi:hypothetical protein
MLRRLVLAAVCLAVTSCGGGGDRISTGDGKSVNRDALIEQLVNGVRGTVGPDGTGCVEDYLRDRSDDELDRLLNEQGVTDLDRAFTAAVVACVDR